jgi:hypothetical protein
MEITDGDHGAALALDKDGPGLGVRDARNGERQSTGKQ